MSIQETGLSWLLRDSSQSLSVIFTSLRRQIGRRDQSDAPRESRDSEQEPIKVGVQAIILNDQDRVLLQKRAGERYGSGEWALPGGIQKPNETIQEAIQRELEEEIGIDISVQDIVPTVAVDSIEPENVHHLQIGFRIFNINGVPTIAEADKAEALEFFNLDELPEPLFGPSRAVLDEYKKVRTDDRRV